MKALFKVDSLGGEMMPNVTLKPATDEPQPFMFMAAANGQVHFFLKGEEERKMFEDGGEFVVEITKVQPKEETDGDGI